MTTWSAQHETYAIPVPAFASEESIAKFSRAFHAQTAAPFWGDRGMECADNKSVEDSYGVRYILCAVICALCHIA